MNLSESKLSARPPRNRRPDWTSLVSDCFREPGNPAVTGRFVEPLRPLLRATLSPLCPSEPTLVEDAVQSTILRLLTLFHQGPPRLLTEGYFAVIARNCLIDELRRRQRFTPLDELLSAPGPDDRELQMLQLQRGMLKLEPRCRYVLQRYYFAGASSTDIARAIGVSPDSIHVVLKRCRDRLRAVMNGDDLPPPAS